MNIVIIVIAAAVSFNTLTFARFNWNKENKRAAIGAFVLSIFTIAAPVILILLD